MRLSYRGVVVVRWRASLVIRTDGQEGIVPNVAVGIVGAVLAGFVIMPLMGGAPITTGDIGIQSIVVSLPGAIVPLAIVNLFRCGANRCSGDPVSDRHAHEHGIRRGGYLLVTGQRVYAQQRRTYLHSVRQYSVNKSSTGVGMPIVNQMR